MNIIAVTQSALAAGMLRQEMAAGRMIRAMTPAPNAAPTPSAPADLSAPPVYDARGRVPAERPVDLPREVVEFQSAGQQVKISAAILERAHDLQGSLLDVLA